MGLLSGIRSPEDIKKLSIDDLKLLAREIRALIIDVTSKTGGHVAPSLGVVELTLALHYIFKTPKDKIVWDVGHQSYAHKILTGRSSQFNTLRQQGGISGFPKRSESAHDCYGAGHSSTSIAVASGILEAMRKRGDDGKVVAVLGDGSMTGGLAFEGLNYAGHRKQDLIVILNDNEMSISKNVGALASFLSRKFYSPSFASFRKEIKNLLGGIPAMGEKLIPILEKAEESLLGFLTPGILFEAFGFNYIGPIDGHDFRVLIDVFGDIYGSKEPTLVHVLTKKGFGYKPAEAEPTLFHGVGPYEIDTGKVSNSSGKISYTEAFSNALIKLAEKDRRVIAMTAAMSSGTGLDKFAVRFPDRFYDVGIAESHATLFAAGLASQGFKPFFAVYSTFLQRAYDQIVHDVCLQKLPVIFAIDRAGIVGEDGSTHQGAFDISYLRHIPNMTVMAPKDENELGHMLKTAVDIDGPVAIRYPRGLGIGCVVEEELKNLPVGRMEVVLRSKTPTVAIFAIGSVVNPAVEAAKRLSSEGLAVDVVNARFAKPIDRRCILDYAASVKTIVTVEENALAGGFGSAVLEVLGEENTPLVKCCRLGIPDEYVEHGKQGLIRARHGLDEEGIYTAVKIFAERHLLEKEIRSEFEDVGAFNKLSLDHIDLDAQ